MGGCALNNRLTPSQLKSLRIVPPELAEYVSCYRQRGIWDNCREDRDLTPAQRRILADRREHHLFINESGTPELVQIQEIPAVVAGRVKAYSFVRPDRPDDHYVLLWAVTNNVQLELPLSSSQLVVMYPFGNRIPVTGNGGRVQVVIGCVLT